MIKLTLKRVSHLIFEAIFVENPMSLTVTTAYSQNPVHNKTVGSRTEPGSPQEAFEVGSGTSPSETPAASREEGRTKRFTEVEKMEILERVLASDEGAARSKRRHMELYEQRMNGYRQAIYTDIPNQISEKTALLDGASGEQAAQLNLEIASLNERLASYGESLSRQERDWPEFKARSEEILTNLEASIASGRAKLEAMRLEQATAA